MEKQAKIYVAGHGGMVGSAILRRLQSEGFKNILTRKSSEFDLRNQQEVSEFFEKEKPEYVFLALLKLAAFMRTMFTGRSLFMIT
jgi:GDP-L-fucose synthase